MKKESISFNFTTVLILIISYVIILLFALYGIYKFWMEYIQKHFISFLNWFDGMLSLDYIGISIIIFILFVFCIKLMDTKTKKGEKIK
jgi:hypothetical protein